jgi:tRNA-splicing ligase RtcB (3'-phosphate/5'-hydroxy nucleic acid ligase)
VHSSEGRAYLTAISAAANYGPANRQSLSEAAQHVFQSVTVLPLDLVNDVSHNLAKIETHDVDGKRCRLSVHRKGATRALPPGPPTLPGTSYVWVSRS